MNQTKGIIYRVIQPIAAQHDGRDHEMFPSSRFTNRSSEACVNENAVRE